MAYFIAYTNIWTYKSGSMGGSSMEIITSIGSGQTFPLNYQHAVVCRSPVTNTVIVLILKSQMTNLVYIQLV
jgi:hypothetical protein